MFVELVDYSRAIGGELDGKVGEARCDQVGAVRSTHFEDQRFFDLPGIIDDQQHLARANSGAKGRRSGLDGAYLVLGHKGMLLQHFR